MEAPARLGDRRPTVRQVYALAAALCERLDAIALHARSLTFLHPLRYEPITFSTARQPATDAEVDGYLVPAGMPVSVCLCASSRDPRRYDRPDDFDVTRTDVRPPTFGAGIHHCLGAALARAELEEVVRLVADRGGTIELTGEATWAPFAFIRRFDQVPVRIS